MNPLTIELNDLRGGRILDVATGKGQFLKLLTESFVDFSEAVGVDTNEKGIETARESCGDGFRLLVMDAETLRFDDDYFDTVAIRHSLHHPPDANAVLMEMKRVLRPGGLFVVCEVFQSPDSDRENSQRHLHHWWAEVDRAQGRTHNETFTRQEILQIMAPIRLTETRVFEHVDEFDPDESKDILDQMIEKCRDDIRTLRESQGPEELIRTGENLIERFGRLGFRNEAYLYVLGRNVA